MNPSEWDGHKVRRFLRRAGPMRVDGLLLPGDGQRRRARGRRGQLLEHTQDVVPRVAHFSPWR